jgi:hypothetical protein
MGILNSMILSFKGVPPPIQPNRRRPDRSNDHVLLLATCCTAPFARAQPIPTDEEMADHGVECCPNSSRCSAKGVR